MDDYWGQQIKIIFPHCLDVKTIFERLGPDPDYSDRVTVDNRALALIIIIDMLPLNKLISPFIWEVRHGSYPTTHTETNNIVSMRICLGQKQGTFIQELTCKTLHVFNYQLPKLRNTGCPKKNWSLRISI